jgi:uridine kinase
MEIDAIIKNLNDLQNGLTIEKPLYDFVNHERAKETEIIEPSDIIIVEGIMVFAIKRLRKYFDIKIFVDTPDDIRFIRRLKRDMEDRGRTLDSIVTQYLTTVRPMHEAFVEPSKKFADIIIPDGGHNEVAMDFLNTKIMQLIKTNHEQ